MDKTCTGRTEKASIKDWFIPIAIAVLFLFWGLLIYFLVGDKGPAHWDFGVVKDIPGQSPYSTERH